MVEKDSILVVDDDEMILESLVSILDSEGYKVRNNGKRSHREDLRRVLQHHPNRHKTT